MLIGHFKVARPSTLGRISGMGIFILRTRERDDDDDLGLNVLGCRVDILGANCKRENTSDKARSFDSCGRVITSGKLDHPTKAASLYYGCQNSRVDHLLDLLHATRERHEKNRLLCCLYSAMSLTLVRE